MSERPRHHAQAPKVAAIRTVLPKGTAIEICWQDEARIG
jgi:hypothetical protein